MDNINIGINEKIVIGRKWRRLIDKDAKLWQRISWWTKSSDVEFNDGRTAEQKVGNINGITSDFLVDDERIAASSKLTNRSYERFNEFTDNGKIKRIFIDENGKPCIEYEDEDGADTVLKKLGGNGLVIYLGENNTYNISDIYDDYQNLTINNFIVEGQSHSGSKNWSSDDKLTRINGSYKLSKTYNPSTGIFEANATVTGSYGTSEHASAFGYTGNVKIKVYLVVLPE